MNDYIRTFTHKPTFYYTYNSLSVCWWINFCHQYAAWREITFCATLHQFLNVLCNIYF
jgi:hypothetical protein